MRLAGLVFCFFALALSASGQIIDGSFESSPIGLHPAAPWVTLNTGTTDSGSEVFPDPNCGFELLMPTDGNNWFHLNSSGSQPGTPTNPASYRTGKPSLSQTFTPGVAGTTFVVDCTFKTNETPGSTSLNDFALCEMEFNGSYAIVGGFAVSSANFTGTSICGTDPITSVQTFSMDLLAAFPGATPFSTFTVSFYCVNGGDSGTSSGLYIDDVRLTTGGTGNPIDIAFNAVAGQPNVWVLSVDAPSFPNVEVFNFLSLVQSVPTGSGPWFGVAFTTETLNQLFVPLGVAPFHVLLDGNGHWEWIPLFIPPGLASLDYVSVGVQGGQIVLQSDPKAITF